MMTLLSRLFRIPFYIVGIIIIVLSIVSAYGGQYIDPNITAYPSILKLAFPIFVVLLLGVGVISLIFKIRFMAIMSVVAIAVCWPAIKSICPLNMPVTEEPGDGFSLLDYNVYYGIDRECDSLDYSRSMSYVINSDADIVCLQEQYALETKVNDKFTKAQIDSLRMIYPYIVEGNSIDVMMLSKYPVERLSVEIPKGLQYFFYDAYKVTLGERSVTIVNLHLSSYDLDVEERDVVEDMRSLEEVKQGAKEFKSSLIAKLSKAFRMRAKAAETIRNYIDGIEGEVVVCGDFNDVVDSWAYSVIAGDDMKDAYLEAGCGPLVTYNAHNLYFNIDHILYRGKLKAVNFGKGNLKSSDHYPIFANFAFY